jgi:hypothetical protein
VRETLGRSAADLDAALQRERERIVVTLRALADTIATTPLPRLSGGLAWMATATDALVRTVQRALGAKP